MPTPSSPNIRGMLEGIAGTGMTNAEIARRLGITRMAVGQLRTGERGLTRPRWSTVVAVSALHADVLGAMGDKAINQAAGELAPMAWRRPD